MVNYFNRLCAYVSKVSSFFSSFNSRRIADFHCLTYVCVPLPAIPCRQEAKYTLCGNFPYITPNAHFFKNLSVYYAQMELLREVFRIILR